MRVAELLWNSDDLNGSAPNRTRNCKKLRIGAEGTYFRGISLGMPSRNVRKIYRDGGIYHAYNRGVNGDRIFVDDHDRRRFLHTLTSRLPAADVAMVAYCLMPNHFHVVLLQLREGGVTRLMHAALTAYARQFNARHERYGSLFQDTFKASGPHGEDAARRAVAYVHLNPLDLSGGQGYEDFEFSSHRLYAGGETAEWFDPATVKRLYGSTDGYLSYMQRAERGRKKLGREVSALWSPIGRREPNG